MRMLPISDDVAAAAPASHEPATERRAAGELVAPMPTLPEASMRKLVVEVACPMRSRGTPESEEMLRAAAGVEVPMPTRPRVPLGEAPAPETESSGMDPAAVEVATEKALGRALMVEVETMG